MHLVRPGIDITKRGVMHRAINQQALGIDCSFYDSVITFDHLGLITNQNERRNFEGGGSHPGLLAGLYRMDR